jgi:hypothetical protein
VGDDRDTSEARSASPAPAQPIVLARGTALVGESGDVIGVVTRERPFECAGECTSAAPMVRVDACAGTRTVQAPRG